MRGMSQRSDAGCFLLVSSGRTATEFAWLLFRVSGAAQLFEGGIGITLSVEALTRIAALCPCHAGGRHAGKQRPPSNSLNPQQAHPRHKKCCADGVVQPVSSSGARQPVRWMTEALSPHSSDEARNLNDKSSNLRRDCGQLRSSTHAYMRLSRSLSTMRDNDKAHTEAFTEILFHLQYRKLRMQQHEI
jgi:hypothetical protein